LIVVLAAVPALAACGKDAPPSAGTETTGPVATTPAIPPRSARDGCKAVATPQP
jgi:hypothetical protein